MKKKVFLKQEFQWMKPNMPEFLEIVGEGKHVEIECNNVEIDKCDNTIKITEEDVYITSDRRNYPKDMINEYYNI